METIDFMKNIIGYYGDYPNSIVRKAVYEYVDCVPEHGRKELLDKLVLTFSTKWKTAPDVAILEDVRKNCRFQYRSNTPALPEPEDIDREFGAKELEAILTKLIKKGKR